MTQAWMFIYSRLTQHVPGIMMPEHVELTYCE